VTLPGPKEITMRLVHLSVHLASHAAFATLVAALAACAADPQYIPAPTSIEVGIEGTDVFTGTVTIDLPVELESADDAMERADRAAVLGVGADELAYVRVGDFDVSIEWTIKNLAGSEGEARISVNGGNQYWYYVPTEFVIDPEEDEEPPPLMGDVPLRVPGSGTLSGVFREDQVREASIDLEQITRGMVNPFAAMLTVNEDDPGVAVPTMLPLEDLSQLIRFDIVFEADRHMVLEYGIRVRDHRNILHDELLSAPAAEIVAWAPAMFVPPPPPP
jgi:hypothetical protein